MDANGCALGHGDSVSCCSAELRSGRGGLPCGAGQCELRRELVCVYCGLRARPSTDVDTDCRAFGDGICMPNCCSELRSWRRRLPCGTCKRQLRRQLVALHGSMRTKFCSDMDADCRAFGHGICVSRCCSRLRPW